MNGINQYYLDPAFSVISHLGSEPHGIIDQFLSGIDRQTENKIVDGDIAVVKPEKCCGKGISILKKKEEKFELTIWERISQIFLIIITFGYAVHYQTIQLKKALQEGGELGIQLAKNAIRWGASISLIDSKSLATLPTSSLEFLFAQETQSSSVSFQLDLSSEKVLDVYLKYRASPNYPNERTWDERLQKETLNTCIYKNENERTKLFFKYGFNVNEAYSNQNYLVTDMEFWIKSGLDPNLQFQRQMANPLGCVMRLNVPDSTRQYIILQMKILLESGANPNAPPRQNLQQSPLEYAMFWKKFVSMTKEELLLCYDQVELLLEYQATPTALMIEAFALMKGVQELRILKTLLQRAESLRQPILPTQKMIHNALLSSSLENLNLILDYADRQVQKILPTQQMINELFDRSQMSEVDYARAESLLGYAKKHNMTSSAEALKFAIKHRNIRAVELLLKMICEITVEEFSQAMALNEPRILRMLISAAERRGCHLLLRQVSNRIDPMCERAREILDVNAMLEGLLKTHPN